MKLILCSTRKEELRKYKYELEQSASQHNLAVSVSSLSDLQKLITVAEKKPYFCDILYLDMNFPEQSGVEIASELRATGFTGEIIFILDKGWNPIRQLQKMFDVRAADCIVRGMCDQERRNDVFLTTARSVKKKQNEQVMFQHKGEQRYISYSDISYFEVQNRIVTVYYGEGEQFSFYGRLDDLAEQLKEKEFMRIHRSYIVNSRKIVCRMKNEVQLTMGEVIPVGRAYERQMKSLLEELHTA